MKQIADNEYYSIYADSFKNRLYLTLKGFWKNLNVVSTYPGDVRKAVDSELKKRFTILADVSQMKTPPQDVAELHVEAQQICVDAGVWKTAEVLGKNAAAQLALNRYSKKLSMTKQSFGSLEEAEAWLDEEDL